MKKITFAIGIVATITICLGMLFKILHLQGANYLYGSGFIGLLLIFLPMLAINRYKSCFKSSLSEKLKIAFGYISTIIISLAILLKILHFPNANILLLVGVFLFIFGFLPFVFLECIRKH